MMLIAELPILVKALNDVFFRQLKDRGERLFTQYQHVWRIVPCVNTFRDFHYRPARLYCDAHGAIQLILDAVDAMTS